jgi:hypothetical protein
MRSMLHGRHRKALGLILAVLVLGVGFCLYDGDEHWCGHPGFDLCLGMLATIPGTPLVPGLPLAGVAAAEHPAPVVAFSLRVPAPPPKALS